ncbi:MAG: type II secretion system protein [Phycisphaerales bacterium]|nr:type II secretion system protein [Phycisphaerales bacterium]
MSITSNNRTRSGFTLVEILIVVVILGILAAVVVPRFAGATEDARIGAFISSLKTYTDACEYYNAREGRYPVDGGSGAVPTGMETYVDASEWTSDTPLSGVWDTEFLDNGVTAAVGVHFSGSTNPGDSVMILVDERFDDGDLSTGSFQKLAGDRYYYILAP